MVIRKQDVVDKIVDYLQHKSSLSELVAWAEEVMMNGDFEANNYREIRDAVALLGLADVQGFGLTWEDAEKILAKLGYRASVEVIEIS